MQYIIWLLVSVICTQTSSYALWMCVQSKIYYINVETGMFVNMFVLFLEC